MTRFRAGWRVRYPCDEHDVKRTESARVYQTKDAAERVLRELRAAFERGESVCSSRVGERDDEQLTFAHWVERWRADGGSRGRGHTGKTSAEHDKLLRLRVLPRWGDRDIRTIRRGELQAWARELSRSGRLDGGPLSPTQVRQAFGLVSGPLRHALSEDVLGADPAAGVKLPPLPPGRRPDDPAARIPVEHVERLSAAMPERLRLLPLLAYYAQLRSSEVVALRRSAVGPAGRTLTLTENAPASGGLRHWSDTKTHTPGVGVAVPASVAEQLREHLERHVGEDMAALLFPATRDPAQPVSEGALRHAWTSALRSAGLPHYTLQDVRAAGESLVADATDLLVAARRARHSPTVALRYYQTTDPAESARVADKLDTLREQGRGQEPAVPDPL